MTKKQKQRLQAFLPQGTPKYIRVYENLKYFDRYIIVFTGPKVDIEDTEKTHVSVSMSCHPLNPTGVLNLSFSRDIIDHIPGRWGGVKLGRTHPIFGKRILFTDLPHDCRDVVLDIYKSIHYLNRL